MYLNENGLFFSISTIQQKNFAVKATIPLTAISESNFSP